MTARQRLRADVAHFLANAPEPLSRYRRFRAVMECEALWAIAVFRFGQYLREDAGVVPRVLFKIPYLLAAKLIGMMVGIHLHPETRIGPGLHIAHYGGVWISPLATLGDACSISQGVVIGVAGSHRKQGPVLGDRVWVGPGATITGPVTVGAGAVIAANSLVTTHIPENGVAIGVPARVISYTGSAKLIPVAGPPAAS